MISERSSTLLVKTPEGIVFSLLLAGPISRFLAWLVDAGCVAVAGLCIGMLLAGLQWLSVDFVRAASVLGYFVASIGYGIALEWFWRGQTVGKRLLRLRVMDAEGLRLQFSQVVIRNLLRFIDMLPAFYLVGGVACLASRRAQRLGDLAASTIVVYSPQVTEPDLDQFFAGKFNSLRSYPHLTARLRQRCSPSEASLALQAVFRRDEFQPDDRVRLFGEIAAHFRSIVEFPAEVCEAMTDEQYVRNIADILFCARPKSAAKTGPRAFASNETKSVLALPHGGKRP